MTNRTTFLAASLALAGALTLTLNEASAQAPSMPTRSGSLAPAGEGPGNEASSPYTSGQSNRSRASVKAQTKAAAAARDLTPAGPAEAPVGMPNMISANTDKGRALAPKRSDVSRASVKTQTQSARSAGSLQPAGEAAQPSNEAPRK